MIRNIFKTAVGAIFVGIVSLSFGQFDSMGQADYMPAIFLNPKVAQDMHLSPEVVSKEQSVMMQQGMALLPYLSQQKGAMSAAQKKVMGLKLLKAYHEMATASLAPLSSAQRVRYRQLSLQFFGPMALAQPKQIAALGITPPQKTRLMHMLTATSQGMASNLKSIQSGGSAGMRGTMGTMKKYQTQTRATQENALRSILTPAQMSKWNAMQGRKLPGVSDIFGGMGM